MAEQQGNLAYYYVTGPVHIYIRVPAVGVGPYKAPGALNGKILFLGHTTESPDPDFVPEYIQVFSSLSGPKVPDDEIFMGGNYKIEMELARFDLAVVNLIKRFPRYGRGAAAGTETFLDRGRLALAHGDTFELWLKNAFYNTPNAAAFPNLTPGYYFSSVRSAGVLPRNLSRDAKKAHVSFKPMPARQGVVGDTVTYSMDPKWFVNLPKPG